MRMLSLLACSAAISLSGCAFQEAHEYRITRSSHSDAVHVSRILHDIAAQAGIPKNVGGYHSDGYMIGWYTNSNVDLNATFHRGEIKIELMRSDWPAPLAFRRADRLLAPTLSTAFGRRFIVEPLHAMQIIYSD
jgi:hypothetical protein